MDELCLHCESAPQSAQLRRRGVRLCAVCGQVAGLRRAYRRTAAWTPAWDAHLQRLVERAKRGAPVAVLDPEYNLPRPLDQCQRKRRRLPRVRRFAGHIYTHRD